MPLASPRFLLFCVCVCIDSSNTRSGEALHRPSARAVSPSCWQGDSGDGTLGTAAPLQLRHGSRKDPEQTHTCLHPKSVPKASPTSLPVWRPPWEAMAPGDRPQSPQRARAWPWVDSAPLMMAAASTEWIFLWWLWNSLMGAVLKPLEPEQLLRAGRARLLWSHPSLCLHLGTLGRSPASPLLLVMDLIKEVLTQPSLRQH